MGDEAPLARSRPGRERHVAAVRAHAGERPAPAPPRPPSLPRIPRATYRVQLHREFAFADAARIVPYLARLGISHLYCSPLLRARAGSMHGYDIIDHGTLNPELGGREGLRRAGRDPARARHGPRGRRGAQPHGRSWAPTTRGGSTCWRTDRPRAHAEFFDIDWRPLDETMAGRVLVPVLGDHYGSCSSAASSSSPSTRPPASSRSGTTSTAFRSTRGSIRAILALAAGTRSSLARSRRCRRRHDTTPEAVAAAPSRLHSSRSVGSRELAGEDPAAAAAIESALAPDQRPRPARRTRSSACTSCSKRRRTGSRTGASPPTRSTTAASSTSTTSPRCAWRTRRCSRRRTGSLLELAAAGKIDGLRIDHPDGLYDPAGYFERLQRGYAQAACLDAAARHRRPAAAAAVGGRGEDPRRARAPRRVLGRARHDRLPLRQRRERPVRRHAREAAVRADLAHVHRAVDRRRPGAPISASARSCAARSPPSSPCSPPSCCASRAPTGARATTRFNTLRQALAEVIACFPGLPHLLRDRASRAGPPLHRLGRGAGAPAQPGGGRDDLRLRPHARCSAEPPPARAPGLRQRLPRVRGAASSSSPRR